MTARGTKQDAHVPDLDEQEFKRARLAAADAGAFAETQADAQAQLQ